MRKKSGFIPEYLGKADIFKEIGGKISSKCLIRKIINYKIWIQIFSGFGRAVHTE
jgi:hypothetical protein